MGDQPWFRERFPNPRCQQRGGLAAAFLTIGSLLLASEPASASDWIVDPAHSHIGFSGVQVGSPFKGEFSRYDAIISFDPAHPESAHIVASIDMTSAHTGDAQRDEALPQADWFDAGKYPRAIFEATGFHVKGGDAWETPGTLSIRGMHRDLVLPFALTLSGDTAHARGHADLVRTDFGVGQGAWASGQWVALDVGVDVDINATRKPGT
jgi:polyisoprenoid-binding protein YceI